MYISCLINLISCIQYYLLAFLWYCSSLTHNYIKFITIAWWSNQLAMLLWLRFLSTFKDLLHYHFIKRKLLLTFSSLFWQQVQLLHVSLLHFTGYSRTIEAECSSVFCNLKPQWHIYLQQTQETKSTQIHATLKSNILNWQVLNWRDLKINVFSLKTGEGWICLSMIAQFISL